MIFALTLTAVSAVCVGWIGAEYAHHRAEPKATKADVDALHERMTELERATLRLKTEVETTRRDLDENHETVTAGLDAVLARLDEMGYEVDRDEYLTDPEGPAEIEYGVTD